MKDSEAIRILGYTTLCTPLGQAAFVGIEAIKEIQQYRAIGTPDQFRAAMAKQTPADPHVYSGSYACPGCGVRRSIAYKYRYCPDCGQRIRGE